MVDDARWMRRAFAHARRGLGRTTPNPLVGACVVSPEGVVLGDGAHERAGEAHAEIHALARAGEAARGAILYCTLEPCSHTGRTGPCTERIIAAGITRVVTAMTDPYPLVQGRGIATLRAHGITVDVGIGEAEARALNRPYLSAVTRGRPLVMLKAAMSLDWKIAAAPGRRTAITGPQALRHAQVIRAQVDAVAIGSETLLVDDPILTVRNVYRERPLTRVVFDRRLRTPPSARLFGTLAAGPVIILTTSDAIGAHPERAVVLEQAGASVCAPSAAGLEAALRALASLGIQNLLVEGGAALHAALWDADLVDVVQLYVAPHSLGASGVPVLCGRPLGLASLFDTRTEILGADVVIEGYVHRPD